MAVVAPDIPAYWPRLRPPAVGTARAVPTTVSRQGTDSLEEVPRVGHVAWSAIETVVLGVETAIVGLVTGIGATAQNYRSSERKTPRMLAAGLALLIGLFAGAVTTVLIAAGGVNTGVSPATLASLPALKTANFAFDQQ